MLKPLALRVNPGQDLKIELDNLAKSSNIEAACTVICTGSLTQAVLRYANQGNSVELVGGFHHSLETQIEVDSS